jgi:hypothetical protein
VGSIVALATVGIAVAAVVWAPRLGWSSSAAWWSWMPVTWGGERGSGQVTTETREVSGFQAVAFGAYGDLTIRQGDAESLTIEAEDNVLRSLTTEVRAGTLYPKTLFLDERDPDPPGRHSLTVRFDPLGRGNVELDGLETDRTELTPRGAGPISRRRRQADTLAARSSGAGSLQAPGRPRGWRSP